MQVVRPQLLAALEERLDLLKRAHGLAQRLRHWPGTEQVADADHLLPEIAALERLKADVFDRWQTTEDLEKLAVEHYPLSQSQLQQIAATHRPPRMRTQGKKSNSSRSRRLPVSDLRRGRIVRVEVPDPQNRNPKCRPAIILTPTAEIRPGGDLVLVAITGSVNAAPADVQVALPWHRQGRTATRLNKPSVAVCTWVFTRPASSIRGYGGVVPDRQMLQILDKIKALEPPSQKPPP